MRATRTAPCRPSFAGMLVSAGCPQCGHLLGMHTKDQVCGSCEAHAEIDHELATLRRTIRRLRARTTR